MNNLIKVIKEVAPFWTEYVVVDGTESGTRYEILLTKLTEGGFVLAVPNLNISLRTTANPERHFGYKLVEKGLASSDANAIQAAVSMIIEYTKK